MSNFKLGLIKRDYIFRNTLLKWVQTKLFYPCSFKTHSQARPFIMPQKILIFRTGSLGDNICALPAFSVIREQFPNASIDILTNAGATTNVSLENIIDTSKFNKIINYFGQSKIALHKLIKQSQYDLFIVLPQYDSGVIQQIKTMLFIRSTGIKYAFGWIISQTFLFKRYQEKHFQFPNERDRLLNILHNNELNTSRPYYIASTTEASVQKVTQVIQAHALQTKIRNVGIVIGSKLKRNQWPLGHFKKVIAELTNNHLNVLLFGSTQDAENANSLCINTQVYNFCGQFTPLETAECMRHCTLVISNDTGPMHLAYMVNTPVIALFSSRDFPGKWYPPLTASNKIFRTPNMSCSICFKNSCKRNTCMEQITPEKVLETALKQMSYVWN